MIRNIKLSKDGPFSVSGGALVTGDVEAYRLVIDMGTDSSCMTAMAICQENGEFSTDYECNGTSVSVLLVNSMYQNPGYITVRLAVSEGDAVITAKEIIFRVLAENNADTIAETQSGTISNIMTAVHRVRQESCRVKGCVTSVERLPTEDINEGDIYFIAEPYSKSIYTRTLISFAVTGIGSDDGSESAVMTFDTTEGFEPGDVVEVYGTDGLPVGFMTIQQVDDNCLYFESIVNNDYMDVLYSLASDGIEDGDTIEIDSVLGFDGMHMTDVRGSIDIPYPADSCVIRNGATWRNISGLGDYITPAQLEEAIKSAITDALGGDY